jgi:hypothetical protein
VPGYCMYRADRNQFGDRYTLLVKKIVFLDQFVLPNVVNVETIAVCLYLHTNTLLLFVSCCSSPDSPLLHSDFDSVVSSFDSVVLVGDTNCKRRAWNCIYVDRNGRMLLSYCLSQYIAINYPDHPTYSHTTFQPSVLDIALSKHCVLSKPLSVPALSFDHNLVVFKILLHPFVSESCPVLEYTYAC